MRLRSQHRNRRRKKISTSKDTEPKKKADRKPNKNIILLTKDSVRRLRDKYEEEEEDDSGLVARVGMSTEAPKATESVKTVENPSRDEGVSGRDLGEVPESSRIEDASHHNKPTVGTTEGAGLEAPRDGENAPSDPLGAIEIGGFQLLPSFAEEMIQEARALKTLSIEGAHEREDPFHDYFTGDGDVTGLRNLEVSRKDSGEASSLFNEAQQALNRASALYREAFSRSRAELSQYEADLRGLTKERNALRLLCGKKEEEIKDIRAELAKAHQDQTDLIEQAKSEAEKAKTEANAIVVVYRADAEAAQVQAREAAEIAQNRAYWISELVKCQSRRKTLEEIHARGFGLTDEIIKAREHEADAGALASSDDDDDAESKSVS
ncbi:uncharacterized protein [Nicotiana tomentosiformis]|uniref:uncharacterized protein n=1 Tax=Nicotiana tomentosiformis TaxID=4098 RepID=UPI00388C5A28